MSKTFDAIGRRQSLGVQGRCKRSPGVTAIAPRVAEAAHARTPEVKARRIGPLRPSILPGIQKPCAPHGPRPSSPKNLNDPHTAQPQRPRHWQEGPRGRQTSPKESRETSARQSPGSHGRGKRSPAATGIAQRLPTQQHTRTPGAKSKAYRSPAVSNFAEGPKAVNLTAPLAKQRRVGLLRATAYRSSAKHGHNELNDRPTAPHMWACPRPQHERCPINAMIAIAKHVAPAAAQIPL